MEDNSVNLKDQLLEELSSLRSKPRQKTLNEDKKMKYLLSRIFQRLKHIEEKQEEIVKLVGKFLYYT